MTREKFNELAGEMARECGEAIHKQMLRAYDALTDSEREKLDTPDKPYLLVRAMGVIMGPVAVEDKFNVQAIKRLIPQVRRILNRRSGW